jgi:hypothetical protein
MSTPIRKSAARFLLANMALVGVSPFGNAALSADCVEISKSASAGLGTTTQVQAGTGGAIIILGERHDSYKPNLQEALYIKKLHENCSLNDVGLEGFTVEDPSFTRPVDANAQIASTMLIDGEINAAEFAYLAMDINVHPLEEKQDRVNFDETHEDSIAILLADVVIESLKNELRLGLISNAQIVQANNDHDKLLALVNDDSLQSLVKKWKIRMPILSMKLKK